MLFRPWSLSLLTLHPLSVIFYGFPALTALEKLHLNFMFPNMNSQNIGLCWWERCKMLSQVQYFSTAPNERLEAGIPFFIYCLFSPSFSSGSPSLRPATPSASSCASGHQHVPEHHVFPHSHVWSSGCLPPLTPYIWDKPNLPAAFHNSKNESHNVLLNLDISVLMRF